jgi:hypothetical protein
MTRRRGAYVTHLDDARNPHAHAKVTTPEPAPSLASGVFRGAAVVRSGTPAIMAVATVVRQVDVLGGPINEQPPRRPQEMRRASSTTDSVHRRRNLERKSGRRSGVSPTTATRPTPEPAAAHDALLTDQLRGPQPQLRQHGPNPRQASGGRARPRTGTSHAVGRSGPSHRIPYRVRKPGINAIHSCFACHIGLTTTPSGRNSIGRIGR